MRWSWLVLASLGVWSCTCQKRLDGTYDEKHATVSCSTQRCAVTQGSDSRRGGCPLEQECALDRCDGGVCEGWCFPGEHLNAHCDARGCCVFSCYGFAGYQCPSRMTCDRVEDDPVMDQLYECTK